MLNQELLGKRIRERRSAQGLTQNEVGQTLGVSAQAVSKWEQGETMPDAALLPSLCNVLRVSADELLGIDGVGIESLGEKLSRYLNQRRGKERETALKTLLPWLHEETSSPSEDSNSRTTVNYYWDEGTLHTLQLWSEQGIACTILSGALASGTSSDEVLAKLRTLLEPSCWNIARSLLSGPKEIEELSVTLSDDASTAVEGAISTLIKTGLVVQDRNGYRLEDQHGVCLTGILQALSCLPRFHGVGQLWHTSQKKANQWGKDLV